MRFGRAVFGICLLAGIAAASPAGDAPLPDRVWRVGIFEAPPYAMKTPDGQWGGIIVDLWKEIAEELNLQYRFGEASPDTILDDIAHGRLDTAAAPFAATIDRQKLLDFSHAFLLSGAGVAVMRGSDKDRWILVLRSLTAPAALRIYVVITVLVFLAGAALWLLERRRNPQFAGDRLSGVGAGFWWSGVTTVGVGYGDKVPITFWGRMLAMLWMFFSLILLTAFTAFVTAKLAVAEFGAVQSVASLQHVIVGTVEGSASAELLRRRSVSRRLYPSVPKALEALRQGDVRAVVYGADILDYYAARDTTKSIEVLPDEFDQQYLAFPLPDGSPLRAPVNEALRRFMAQPAWRDLQDRYLGAALDFRNP
jgi:ABC-type amino acid transport substrate-binding protein